MSTGRQDDLTCSHACVTALCAVAAEPAVQHVSAVVLFDNEEIGSQSATGARGAWLGRQLERSVLARGGSRDDFLRAVAQSVHVSADMAQATNPNYADKHDPQHWIALGGGPVLKMSANVLYSTTAATHAAFLLAAEQASVPVQHLVNRSGLMAGSTIGPIVAAGLAMPTVDVGNPTLAMHSARELSATADAAMLIAALTAFLQPALASGACAGEIQRLGRQRQPVQLRAWLEAQPLTHRRALVRIEGRSVARPDQRGHPARGQLDHQLPANQHREDPALVPQRTAAESAAASRRRHARHADELVDQFLVPQADRVRVSRHIVQASLRD